MVVYGIGRSLVALGRGIDDWDHGESKDGSQYDASRDGDTNEATNLAFGLTFNSLWGLHGAKCADVAVCDREQHQVDNDEPVILEERNIEGDQKEEGQEDRPQHTL